MNVEKRNQLLSIVLGIIVIILGYFLYRSIVDPYKEVEIRKKMTQQVHYRMGHVRDALVVYESRRDSFPPTNGGLDSLVKFIKTDSLMKINRDSVLELSGSAEEIETDSLIYSPRPPHKKFEYTLNDSLRPEIYLLKDPDSDSKVGSLEETTKLNAGNWE